MAETTSILLALAQIAGIFVGFGALISFTQMGEVGNRQYLEIAGVVQIGLVNIITAMLPITLNQYGLDHHSVWQYSSYCFLVLNFSLYLVPFFADRSARKEGARATLSKLPSRIVFVTDLPLFALLLIIVINLYGQHHGAMYVTAIIISLIQAAILLTSVTLFNESKH